MHLLAYIIPFLIYCVPSAKLSLQKGVHVFSGILG